MKKITLLSVSLLSLFGLLVLFGRTPLTAQEDGNGGQAPDDTSVMTDFMRRVMADRTGPTEFETPLTATPCVGGMAGIYPCENVDLLAHLSLADLSASDGNDSWGWTDPLDGKEYALMGLDNGTAFVDISDPENPIYLGKLPTHTSNSIWRDIKVYANYAFVVSEASNHGMQVFDLTRLRTVVNPPVTFTEDGFYGQFGHAHNLVINEDSGYAYAVGTGTCAGGLHMVNIQTPTSPTNAGCFSADGYTHDAQCVNYTGPDPDHQGDEICFAYNEDTITIVNVTNKAAPVQLSRTPYAGSAYTHQGWLTPDQQYILHDDELDEQSFGHNTYTYVWDASNLEAPVLLGHYTAAVASIDHNLYTKDGYAFEANYRSGLRILDLTNLATPANITEAAYFDTYPTSDSASFNGAWSNYPYFDSGVVIISDIESGLFIVRPNIIRYGVTLSPDNLAQTAVAGQTVTYTLSLENTGNISDTYDLSISGNNWDTTIPTNTVHLTPGEQLDLVASVAVPVDAMGGEMDTATVMAVSQANPATSATADLVTSIDAIYGLTASTTITEQSGLPGTTLTFTLQLTNTGNTTDSYDVQTASNWPAQITPASVPLASGASGMVDMAVTIPLSATANSSDIITVTVISQGDNGISQTLLFTAVAMEMPPAPSYPIYLPVIFKP